MHHLRQSRNWLTTHNIPYEERNIKTQNPTYDELKAWHEKSGLPLRRFFNTSGIPYRELGLKNRLPTLSDEDQLRLLATNGMLVKRPLLVGDNFVLVGFREADWEAALIR